MTARENTLACRCSTLAIIFLLCVVQMETDEMKLCWKFQVVLITDTKPALYIIISQHQLQLNDSEGDNFIE